MVVKEKKTVAKTEKKTQETLTQELQNKLKLTKRCLDDAVTELIHTTLQLRRARIAFRFMLWIAVLEAVLFFVI